MNYLVTTHFLEKMRDKRNLFVALLVLSLGINLLQGIERLFHQEKVVILPPDIQKEVWVRGVSVSASYIEEWVYYLSSLLLSGSPQTIDYQTDLTLRHISPHFYGTLKKQLRKTAAHLKKNNATMAFFPKDVVVDEKTLTATLTGTLSSFIGNEKVSEHQQTYELAFEMTKGKFLYLKQFELKKSGDVNREADDVEEKDHA